MRFSLCVVLLVCSLVINLSAQTVGPPAPPAVPVEAVELDPLVFDPPLPTDPIATVNGQPVPASDMLKLVLEQNFQNGVNMLVMGVILDRELVQNEKTVSETGIRDELKTMLEQTAPGTTIEHMQKESPGTLMQMLRTARINRGWKELYWDARSIPEDQRHSNTTQIMMQLYLREVMEKYERRIRGANPAPAKGCVAQVVEKNATNPNEADMRVGASEALDFLMALVKHSGLIDAAKQSVERTVIDQALAKANVAVTEKEVAEWALVQRKTYPPPLVWEQICRFKGTTPEREMERWRRIQAWKRSSKVTVSDEDVEAFLNENKSYFLGKTKKVSHILFQDVNAATGLPLPEGERQKVKEKAEHVYKLLQEGTDFAWLAEHYSEDPVTARGQGRMAQPIKQFGGGLDPAFRDAAWAMTTVGEFTNPVHSAFGWHIIKLDEVKEPGAREPDFKAPSYWSYVVDEYETRCMQTWLDELKTTATIEMAPVQEILSYKERSYIK